MATPGTGTTDLLSDLELLLRSRYALVALETDEEDRAESLLRHLADRLSLPFFVWTRTKGLRRGDDGGPVYDTASVDGALAHIEASELPALYHLKGPGPDLEDARVARSLKDAAAPFAERKGAVVLTGEVIPLPTALRPMAARVSMPPPDVEEYRDLLRHIVRDLRERDRLEVEQTEEERERLLRNLEGLTLMEAEKVLTRVMVEDGRLSADDVRQVVEAKRELVEEDGLLEYYPVEEALSEIADLDRLKEWLAKREAVLREPERAEEFGLPFPRGLLLLGVPGCGKSLSAKAVAREWTLPLLRLDPSRLYNKYVGETERNFRRAVRTAERMAPVVLWIDEIEKALATAVGEDGGVSTRILGSFLSWMQEREGDVFVVATANDVSRLPPALLRRGRFDEVFFVDLPDRPTRSRIFEIHLRKRGREPAGFELDRLSEATEGFSGAEVEGVVVAGLHTAFGEDRDLDTELLLEEARATRPLSQTMEERIEELRAWAGDRTVPAG